MAEARARPDTAERVIETIKDGQTSALDAVHKFLDSVNDAFPDVGSDDGPRRKIIDSAFKMAGDLVGTWSDVASHLAKVSQEALREPEKAGAGSKS
jgi:hypothetical protein